MIIVYRILVLLNSRGMSIVKIRPIIIITIERVLDIALRSFHRCCFLAYINLYPINVENWASC
jgi:hypothetical protein